MFKGFWIRKRFKLLLISSRPKPLPFRVVLLTQFGANFISQLIASISDISKARVAAENILEVIREAPVDMDNLSDEGLRPVRNTSQTY